MPIRAEYRRFYRGPHWADVRAKILKRAGNKCEECGMLNGDSYFNRNTQRLVKVQLGVAHLDHDDIARFYDEGNLRAWCRACHLRKDNQGIHRTTRQTRKDRARPLLQEIA
jgi:5-methylcytosine-specific restriction endonuclease McrA